MRGARVRGTRFAVRRLGQSRSLRAVAIRSSRSDLVRRVLGPREAYRCPRLSRWEHQPSNGDDKGLEGVIVPANSILQFLKAMQDLNLRGEDASELHECAHDEHADALGS